MRIQASPISRRPSLKALVLLAGTVLTLWSVIFARTYSYAFHWDDLHLIRPFSADEVKSIFRGWNDPDRIETPALRPLTSLLFALQAVAFGENVILQRLLMIVLAAVLLVALGLLLREAGLGAIHIAIVFALFVASRVFATLVMWLSLGGLLACYAFITLTAYWFLLWLRRGQPRFLLATILGTAVAVLMREETYTLPLVLCVLWAASSRFDFRRQWRRAFWALSGVSIIILVQIIFRAVLIPEAPKVKLAGAMTRLMLAAKAAWLPGGHSASGFSDQFLRNFWVGLIVTVFIVFARVASVRMRLRVIGIVLIGFVMCLPALAVPRAFGIAMPTVAFMTALAIAIVEVARYALVRGTSRPVVILAAMILLTCGLVAGVRRSVHVAASLDVRCAIRVIRDGYMLFDMYPKPATVPPPRQEAGVARLAGFGIHSARDVKRLEYDVIGNQPEWRTRHPLLFTPKYDYLSF